MASNKTISEFAHLQIPLEEIVKATDNFADESIIGKGGFGNVYKGKLMRSGKLIIISARRLDRRHGQGKIEFWTEISVLSSLEHENLVSIIGFCDEKNEKIIITHYYPKGSLSMHLSDTRNLTWMERLRISHGIVSAIEYLHEKMGESYYVIHRNINTSTVLLDDNWIPKLSGFEFSIKQPIDRKYEDFFGEAIGTQGYMDPEIEKNKGVILHKSDIYSLGIVLFEILCGRKAFIPKDDFLAPLAKFHYEKATLQHIINPDLWDQMKPESLAQFSNAAYGCLLEVQSGRSDNASSVRRIVEQAIKIEKGDDDFGDGYAYDSESEDQNSGSRPCLYTGFTTSLDQRTRYQLKSRGDDIIMVSMRIPLEDIKLATQNFCHDNYIGGGGFGRVYKGEHSHMDMHGNRQHTIVAKQLDRRNGQGDKQFYNELRILTEYRHENIISFVGYNNDADKRIIVYEHAPKGSLDKYINDVSLTWRNRLKICIDFARGLDFLHGGGDGREVMIHRDIKTANILLFDDWKAKIGDFGLSIISTINEQTDYVIDHTCGTPGYLDPLYLKSGFLTIESDIYSFGVVLFEILCGRSTFESHKNDGRFLPSFIKHKFEEGKQGEAVFEALKKEIMPKSLTTFQNIAYQCLDDDRKKRPKAKEVLGQLKKALEFQVDENI